jgi:hypothetical protein
MLARHVDGLLMLAVALWTSSVGFGWLPLDPQGKSPSVAKFKRHAPWMGPLLAFITILLMLAGQA